MNQNQRDIIYKKYNGKCAYCGCELKKGWHVDHINPLVREVKWNPSLLRFKETGAVLNPENESFENLNPSCPSCNIQKNSFSLEEFRSNIKKFVASLNLYSTQYKFAKKFNLINENDIEVEFYFEKINKA